MAVAGIVISPCGCSSGSSYGWKWQSGTRKSSPRILSTTRSSRSLFLARASSNPPPPPQQQQQESDAKNAFSSQDDLNYLWKLAAGSVAGAAVIKYGSALFPGITRPNILQALLMIMIPVFVSVIILLKESSMTENQDPF